MLYISKFNKYPNPKDFFTKYGPGEDIVIEPTTGSKFEITHFYLGVFSMSGLSIKIGFGLYKDPFGANSD